jgi:hypothetical protein
VIALLAADFSQELENKIIGSAAHENPAHVNSERQLNDCTTRNIGRT